MENRININAFGDIKQVGEKLKEIGKNRRDVLIFVDGYLKGFEDRSKRDEKPA